jgi:hypothetical protein
VRATQTIVLNAGTRPRTIAPGACPSEGRWVHEIPRADRIAAQTTCPTLDDQTDLRLFRRRREWSECHGNPT